MTTVAVSQPLRTFGQSLSPESFADIAACESVAWGPSGELVVTFAGDLTLAQVAAVKIRCIAADETQEQTLLAGWQALQSNRDYLAVTPTTAQAVAQVAALTRQVNGLIRYVTRDQ